jgi:hypothetical protein
MISCNNKEETVKKPQEILVKNPQEQLINPQSNSQPTVNNMLHQMPLRTLFAGIKKIISKKEYITVRKA